MNENVQEVHNSSLAWLEESLSTLAELPTELTPGLAAQFWAAVAQEAACVSAIMVRNIDG